MGLRGSQSERLVEAEAWRGLDATPFGADARRTPESIYQELFNTPSPKTDGETHRVGHTRDNKVAIS